MFIFLIRLHLLNQRKWPHEHYVDPNYRKVSKTQHLFLFDLLFTLEFASTELANFTPIPGFSPVVFLSSTAQQVVKTSAALLEDGSGTLQPAQYK